MPKYGWKNASTLMLIARRLSKRVMQDKSQPHAQHTPIPTARTSGEAGGFNYSILIQQRSSKSKFMPNAYVFPGGISDKIDFDNKWMDILGTEWEKMLQPAHLPDRHKIPMMMHDSVTEAAHDSRLPPEICFRLCAIREAFEESGVLLCKPKKKHITDDKDGIVNITDVDPGILSEWRHRVQENSISFLDMCEELQLVPDVNCLYEWSDWLTPNHLPKEMGGNRRYDTVFYIAFTEAECKLEKEEREVAHCGWYSVEQVLQDYHNREYWIAPPQLYEMSRLFQNTDFNSLLKFSVERQESGIERWLPVRVTCKDGQLSVLPGDGLYPLKAMLDVYGERDSPCLDMTISEAQQFQPHHRFEIRSMFDTRIEHNISPASNHVPPATFRKNFQ